MRYTQLLDADGHILDDLMVTRLDGGGEDFFLVVNAATKRADFDHIAELPDCGLKFSRIAPCSPCKGPARRSSGAASSRRRACPSCRQEFAAWRGAVGHFALRLYRRRRV